MARVTLGPLDVVNKDMETRIFVEGFLRAIGNGVLRQLEEKPPTDEEKHSAMERDRPLTGELVRVKGGCFKMGDTFGDGGPQERPVHEVCVKDFYLGKYEVTQGQWQAVMGNNPSQYTHCGSNCPVENVSWNMVQDFITKLNAKAGKNYRLPTEAEWEYAARSGGKQEKYAGTSNPSDLGRYRLSHSRTYAVGEKQPNELGLYDMTGNVGEWCQDWYGQNYYSQSPKNNPPGPSDGEYRVVRGGFYMDTLWGGRTACRSVGKPEEKNNFYGFRLSLSAP